MLFDLVKIAFQSRQSPEIMIEPLDATCCVAAVLVFWLNYNTFALFDYLWFLLLFSQNAVMLEFFVGSCSV